MLAFWRLDPAAASLNKCNSIVHHTAISPDKAYLNMQTIILLVTLSPPSTTIVSFAKRVDPDQTDSLRAG